MTSNTNIESYKNEDFETTFIVKIGQAYYNDGFFNVRAKYSDLFGSDKSILKIQLGENRDNFVQGYINRTANGKYGYPRIMAGKYYTNWIKDNFKQGDIFIVNIIRKDFIQLNKKSDDQS